MAIAAYLVNQPAASGDGAVIAYKLYITLKAGNWIPVMDSDGTTQSGTGAQITHAGTGANGMKNTNAYWVLQQPTGGTGYYAGTRQIRLRMVDTAGQIQLTYSQSGVFTGGTGSTPPTATDEQNLWGTAGTYSNAAFRYHIIVTDASENFGWWLGGWTPGGAAGGGLHWKMDPLRVPDPLDTDPFVFSNVALPMDHAYLAQSPSYHTHSGYFDHGGGTEQWSTGVNVPTYGTGLGIIIPNGLGTDPEDTRHTGFPMLYFKEAAQSGTTGYKGISSLMRYAGVLASNGLTYTVSTPKDYIRLDDVLIRWNEIDVPSI